MRESWHISSDGESVSVFRQGAHPTDSLIFFGLLMGNDYDNGVRLQDSANIDIVVLMHFRLVYLAVDVNLPRNLQARTLVVNCAMLLDHSVILISMAI